MLRFITTLCLIMLLALTACAPSFQATDLNGTWVGEDYTINSRGHSRTTKEVILHVDAHGLIRGSTSWTLQTGSGGHDNERPVARDTEEVIGVFDHASGTFYLVEMSERGFWHGSLLSPNCLQAFLVQSGEKPVASSIKLKRKPSR